MINNIFEKRWKKWLKTCKNFESSSWMGNVNFSSWNKVTSGVIQGLDFFLGLCLFVKHAYMAWMRISDVSAHTKAVLICFLVPVLSWPRGGFILCFGVEEIVHKTSDPVKVKGRTTISSSVWFSFSGSTPSQGLSLGAPFSLCLLLFLSFKHGNHSF